VTTENRLPLRKMLDDLPKALYVVAHVVFLSVGAWLYARAVGSSLPYSGALILYPISQVVFFGYFARLITLKMAVLAEQTLMFALVLWIVLEATA